MPDPDPASASNIGTGNKGRFRIKSGMTYFYMDNKYGNVIWTNHALERLRERGIRQSDALATFNSPEQSRRGSNERGSWIYYRTYGKERIEVVAKKNEQGEWIILSVWSKPVYQNKQSLDFQSQVSRRKNQGIFVRFLKWLFR